MRGYATHPTADSTLADFSKRSKRSLYNPPAACVAPPPTLPVDSCVGCVPSGTHALFGLYRSGRLKANAFRRPFLPNFIRYPAALCVLVRETLDSTQQAVACINRPTACVATPHTLPASRSLHQPTNRVRGYATHPTSDITLSYYA